MLAIRDERARAVMHLELLLAAAAAKRRLFHRFLILHSFRLRTLLPRSGRRLGVCKVCDRQANAVTRQCPERRHIGVSHWLQPEARTRHAVLRHPTRRYREILHIRRPTRSRERTREKKCRPSVFGMTG